MELQSLETVVRRLVSDADFRAVAMANPDAALSEFDLGADAQAAVLKLCGQIADDDDFGDIHFGSWF